jgi:hypothetical protein
MPMYSSTEFNTTPHLRQQHYNPYNERAYSVQNVDGQIDVNRDNNMRHNMVHDSQAPQSATKETRMGFVSMQEFGINYILAAM